MEHENPDMQDEAGENSGKKTDSTPSGFRTSQSRVQGMYLNQPKEQAQENTKIWEPKEKKKGFFQLRLGPEHLFGTLMAFVYIYRWTKGTTSALPKALTPPHSKKGDSGLIRDVSHVVKNAKELGVGGTLKEFRHNTERPWMLFAMVGSLLINIGIMLSSRGAEVPEGETLGRRMINTLKHPNQSAMQTNAILMSATITALSASKLNTGIHGMRDNKKGTLAYSEGLANVTSGIAYLISNPLIFLGIMGMKRSDKKDKDKKNQTNADTADGTVQAMAVSSKNEPTDQKPAEQEAKNKPSAFSKSESRIFSMDNLKAAFKPYSPKALKSSFSYAIKHDPMGLTARALAVVAETGFIIGGSMRMKSIAKGDYKELSKTDQDKKLFQAKAGRDFGIMGVIVTLGQGAYTYGRIYMDSIKEQGQNNAVQMAR